MRQPLPAEIGGGTIIGIMGNPDCPEGSGDTADASCTGACEAGNSPTTAGGAVSLPPTTSSSRCCCFFHLGFLIPILKVRFEFPYVIYQGLTMYLRDRSKG